MSRILITPRGFAKYGFGASLRLQEVGFNLDINETGEPLPRDTFVEKAKLATAIIVGVDELNRDLLMECKNLKVIVKFGVGTDNIDLVTCKELGIKVGKCIGTNTNAVAEYTIGLMFCAARNIADNYSKVKLGSWIKPTGFELSGKTLGVIGFGAIGKRVARIAGNIGMKLIVFDPFMVNIDELKDIDIKLVDFKTLIENSDFITIHVPLTNDTANLISINEFKSMKGNAVLINTSRGGIVDERELYHALKNGDILACASDVFSSEPPTNDEWIRDLISLDNFILTAHIASRSEEAEKNTVDEATNQVIKLLK